MSISATRLASLSGPQRELLERRLESLPVDLTEIPILPGATRAGDAPLSFPQQRLWFLQQLDPAATAYNLQWAIRMRGTLDTAALERSITEIITRHEVLRTSFVWRDGELVQTVRPAAAGPLVRPVDLTELPSVTQTERVAQVAQTQVRQPFNLTRDDLVRADLVRMRPDDHLLLVTLHHIVSDGWSQNVLMGELSVLYQAFSAGQPVPLEPLPVQYSDYAAWQRKWLSGSRLRRPLSYWRQRLQGLPSLRLPGTRLPQTGAVPSAQAREVQIAVPSELTAKLTALGRGQGATLFMVVMAGLQAALSVYSGQADFGVGMSIANRRRPELAGLIGFFANTLVLRADVALDRSFDELVRVVRDDCVEAYEHQDLPFERLIEEMRTGHDAGHSPLFQVMLNMADAAPARMEIPGLEITVDRDAVAEARFGLELTLALDAVGNLSGRFLYPEGTMDPAVTEGLADTFQRLLAAAAAQPRQRLSELDLLSAEERGRQLGELARGQQSAIPSRCTHELVADMARQRPDEPAVVCGDEVLSYRQLDHRAGRLAGQLRQLGVRRESPVAVCLDRSADLAVALLAVLKAGGAYLPLDPGYPAERMRFMLEDSAAQVVVTSPQAGEKLAGFDGAVVRMSDLAGREEPDRAEPDPAGTELQPDNLAYVIYTSGSTGRPKGVMITHRNLTNFLQAMATTLPITSQDEILAMTTVSFDIAGLELWGALSTGACVHVAPNPLTADWPTFRELAESHEITALQGTPSTWRFLLDRGWTPPPGLKLWCGGENLPAGLANRLTSSGAQLRNLYGPTETTIWSAQQRISEGQETVPIGSPIDNTQLYVLNPGLKPVPPGASGELFIGGAGLARGYLGLPGTTAERFVPDPFGDIPGARLYRTGDLVCRHPDGSLQFLGRTDQQVKVRGFRVEPGEIENVLTQHPMVADAAVSIVTGPDEAPALVGYLEPRLPDTHRDQTAEHAHLEHWETVWASTYADDDAPSDDDLDTAGWHSAYDGEPIPRDEMAEWAETSVELITELRPRRVLEIGCGSGMILLRVAPATDSYWATDVAEPGLARLRDAVGAAGLAEKVHLRHQPAHDFDGLTGEDFDVVLLNSVAQYFPSADYLSDVLDGAMRRLAPGGAIVIGDVRNLELLEAFHSSVLASSAPADLSLDTLREQVAAAVRAENELALSPAFFTIFAETHGLVADVRTKPGTADNELTRYRFDVVLRSPAGTLDAARVDWADLDGGAQALTAAIGNRPALTVTGVPSPRLAADHERLKLLDEKPDGTVGDLHREPVSEAADATLALDDLRSAAAADCPVTHERVRPGHPFVLDVVLQRKEEGSPARTTAPTPGPHPDEAGPVANQPARGQQLEQLKSGLLEFLQAQLPVAMVPSALVVMDRLPLTPNGKIDRKQLPQAMPGTGPQRDYVAPRTTTEKACAQIMASLLELPRLGVHDDFFELGGHSLLAARLAAELEAAFDIYLPLQTIFERATVANVASIVDQVKQAQDEVGGPVGDNGFVMLPAPLEAAADITLNPTITPEWETTPSGSTGDPGERTAS
jgi:amino acid adenylation domain-containing protein